MVALLVDSLRYRALPFGPCRLQARLKTQPRLAAIDRGRVFSHDLDPLQTFIATDRMSPIDVNRT